jgi:hypothetical protein
VRARTGFLVIICLLGVGVALSPPIGTKWHRASSCIRPGASVSADALACSRQMP